MRENYLKKIMVATIYRDNSVRKILFGPSRGLKYKVNLISGRQAIYGNYEKHTQKALVSLVKKDMIVYDIGANVGLFTLLLSKLVGKFGHVYSFEPVPLIADQIRINTKLNNLDNVTVITKAVSDSAGLTWFDQARSYSEGHIVDNKYVNKSNLIQVSCVSLDHFVFSEKNPPPEIMKIDVEGGESRVLNGSYRLIEKYRPIIVCELHKPTQDLLVGKILIEHRYRAYRLHGGPIQRLDEGWPSSTGLWGNFVCYPVEKASRVLD